MLARIVLETATDDYDGFVIDVLLDSERCIIKKSPTFGVWGALAPNRDSVWPFVFRPSKEGRDILDFGTFPEEFGEGFEPSHPTRFGSSNLSHKKISVGEYASFWLWSDDVEICCRIRSVTAVEEG